MNTTDLTERLRAVNDLEVDNVEAIISEAVRQGRRRRVRQRALPALIGVIVLVTAVSLAGILAVRDGRSPTPVATPTSSTATATPSTNPDELTSADVLALVRSHLPKGMSATEVSYWGNPEADEQWRQAVVRMTLNDAAGPAQAEAGLDHRVDPRSGCTREGHCRRIRAGGRTFYEFTDWKTHGGVRLYDVGTYYQRPDGKVTFFKQHNFVHDGGPTLPLTVAEVQALLTATEWDALADRCQPEEGTTYC
ncbi:MAG TPA: hypothetical protein VNT24_12545 [Propionibacteriaceae bacterium]|nr:hypothetical protein [Propionibacteriaceae bacterium]